MTRIAVNHRQALHNLADCGLLNELNAQSLFDELILKIRQPANGYFYITDVMDFAENKLKELLK